jgi:trigger factor
MQAVKKNLSDTKIQLTLVADAQLLDRVKQEALDHLGHDMKLPGFRPGKAPAAIIEKNANPAALQSEFLDRAMNALYGAALGEHNIHPVAQPDVKITKFVPFETLELDVTVDVIGDIKLPDYKNVKLAKKDLKITAKDVDGVLDELKKRESEKKDVTRAAKLGDQAWIDFKGVDAKTKEPINGADGKEYPLLLGSNTFIPGFEDNLAGMKAGEEKTFVITFPKDYGVKALQSRKVEFTVTVTKVQEVVEPKIDDAFAEKVGPFKTVAELKADIKKQLENEKQSEVDRAFADELITKLTKDTKVAIPASLIDDQLERILNDQRQNLLYRGQTWQEYLEAQGGLTEEAYKQSLRPDAELRVKAGLVLSEIAEKEKIDVTLEELEAQIQMLKGRYPDAKMQAELDKPEARREIASRMMSEKTIAKLTAYASAK